MTPEQETLTYTADAAKERLNLDDTQLARLMEKTRAPLWYQIGGKIFFSRATVDAMAAERAASIAGLADDLQETAGGE